MFRDCRPQGLPERSPEQPDHDLVGSGAGLVMEVNPHPTGRFG
jgi:hypothetical protein